jgi:DNA-binding transcriptional LysR family regulator
LKLRQLEVFVAVYTHGSVANAAQTLHISAPAISRMLSQFEAQLRFALFSRVKGRLQPTQEGVLLFESSKQIFEQLTHVSNLSTSLKGFGGRTLHIGCSPSASQKIVPQAVRVFTELHPTAKVVLDVYPIGKLIEQLLSLEIDLAVSLIDVSHPDIITENLFRVPIVCAFRSDHPFAKVDVLNLTDLIPYQFIKFHSETTQGQTIQRELTRANVGLKSSITVRSAASAIHLVRATGGITLVDEVSARDCGQSEITYRPIRNMTDFCVSVLTFNRNKNSNLIDQFKACLKPSSTNG